MTLREEAYALIDKLPDKVLKDVVQSLKTKDNDPKTWETPEQERKRLEKEQKERWEAFLLLEKLRKEHPLDIPENYEEVYADALAPKP